MAFRFSFRSALGRNPHRFSFPTVRYRFATVLALVCILAVTFCPGHALAWVRSGSGSNSGLPCNAYYQSSLAFNSTADTIEFCDGSNWTNLLSTNAAGDQLDLGTSAIATNPSVTGDLTTGLFSAATSTVSVATGGVQRMTVNGSGYVGIGTATPAAKLDVWGGIDINGGNAISFPVSSGVYNLAVGTPSVLLSLTSGSYNLAVGPNTLQQNSSGSSNVALGYKSLQLNTTGQQNVAIGGYAALLSNTTGNSSVAIGYSALSLANSTNNTAIGAGAGSLITSGANNTVLGYGVASTTLTTGSSNILIGASAAVDTPVAATSNFLNIGNVIFATGMTGTLSAPAGSVGIGTTAPAYPLEVMGTVHIGSFANLLLDMGSLVDFGGGGYFQGGSDGFALIGGNVGIGSTIPQGPLDVEGGTADAALDGDDIILAAMNGGTGDTNGGNIILKTAMYSGGGGVGDVIVSGPGNLDIPPGSSLNWYAGYAYIVGDGSGNLNLSAGQTNQNIILTPTGTGGVGIGTAAPAEPLEIYSSGSGVLLQLAGSSGTCNHTPGSSSETVSCSSDMRLKSGAVDAPSALPWLSSIRVRDFTWKNTGQKRTGVIAQELQMTRPEMVAYDKKKDEWTVEQPNPWTLVKILQEQQAEIDDLKKQLASKH